MTTSLLDLPDLPLFKILRFLDEKSLRKAELVSSSLYAVARKNRTKLVNTNIFTITIMRGNCESSHLLPLLPNVRFYVQLLIEKWNRRLSGAIHFPIDNGKVTETDKNVVKRWNPNDFATENTYFQICDKMTLVEWMTGNLVNVSVRELRIEEFAFTESEVSHLEECLPHNNLQIDWISAYGLHKYEKRNFDLLLRFCKAVDAKTLFYIDQEPGNSHVLATDHFLTVLPSFDEFRYSTKWECLEDEEVSDPEVWLQSPTLIPATFYAFPPHFEIGPGLLVDISSIRKALHEWAHNRLRIIKWDFLLSGEFENENRFLEAIDLPFEVKNKMIYTRYYAYAVWNCAGAELNIAHSTSQRLRQRDGDVSCWTFYCNTKIDRIADP